MNNEAVTLLSELGLTIKATERAGNLSVGKQQIIEIAKALKTKAEIIIMDDETNHS